MYTPSEFLDQTYNIIFGIVKEILEKGNRDARIYLFDFARSRENIEYVIKEVKTK